MLSAVMLTVTCADCHKYVIYAECCYADCHGAKLARCYKAFLAKLVYIRIGTDPTKI
jgi:hypothetical protein